TRSEDDAGSSELIPQRGGRIARQRLRDASNGADALQPADLCVLHRAPRLRKMKDLLAWTVDPPLERPPALLVRAGVRIRARHSLTIRSVDMSDFDREIERFVRVYCRAWRDNWGFVEPTRAEVRQLASELRYVVDRDLVLAADVNGALVGCAIALPDLNQGFAGTNGRLLPGLLRLLTRKRYVTQARVLLFGVVPEWRISGVAGPLIIELLSRTASLYRRAELSWVLEDNDSTNSSVAALGGRVYKRYRIYQKDLGA